MSSKLFVYPTDTVWGIGGDIFSEECYQKIALVKGHTSKKPLSIIFKNFEMITELIELPSTISRDWLADFFKLESTIGLPKSWSKKDLPHWICQDSEYISIRCMDLIELRPVFEEVGGPVTSTSLNLTGKAPIVRESDARDFFNNFMGSGFFSEKVSTECSGRSSTIVLFDGKEFNFLREGKYIDQIREHVKLLTT